MKKLFCKQTGQSRAVGEPDDVGGEYVFCVNCAKYFPSHLTCSVCLFDDDCHSNNVTGILIIFVFSYKTKQKSKSFRKMLLNGMSGEIILMVLFTGVCL